jgi:hypothetical protein
MIEQNDVAISIPFQVFANAVKSMNLQEKQALLAVLEIELAEAQEDWERDPDIQQAKIPIHEWDGHGVGRRRNLFGYQHDRLVRRPTVRLSSRRSPMPQRVPPATVGAWGAAGYGDVSTPIDRSAARRARLGTRSILN